MRNLVLRMAMREDLLIRIVWAEAKTFRTGPRKNWRRKFWGLQKVDLQKADKNARYWIERLQLEPHPEGGYFRQTYKAKLVLPEAALPAEFKGARAASTAIYFLLEGKNFSAFHRLRSDEVWHFYAGEPLVVHVIEPEGEYSAILLGRDLEAGQVLHAVVRAGCWFASHVVDWKSFAVVGCTVAPGFDFEDFEMGKRGELGARYPQHREVIERLTRG
jgi:predicted cupin superfamily sugar epimerase